MAWNLNEEKNALWNELEFTLQAKGWSLLPAVKGSGAQLGRYEANLTAAINGSGGLDWYNAKLDVTKCVHDTAEIAVKVAPMVDANPNKVVKKVTFDTACIIKEYILKSELNLLGVLCA